jgi:hypothetical protein
MNLPPGFESTQRAIDTLQKDGAMIVPFGAAPILCEERSTLKAMRVLRSRGRNLAEVKRRLVERPRLLIVVHEGLAKPWPLEELDAIPDDDIVVCNRRGRAYLWLEFGQVAVPLSVFSPHPAMIAWQVWLCREFGPALLRHGYYNPATNHEPPPFQFLDALERREEGRDVFNQLVPGLGDWFAESK